MTYRVEYTEKGNKDDRCFTVEDIMTSNSVNKQRDKSNNKTCVTIPLHNFYKKY